MPCILIVDCCDTESQNKLALLGARANVPLFEEALRLHDPAVQCVSINLADQEMPAGFSLAGFDGVMLTGSPLCVCDPLPEVRRQIDFARAVFATDLPVWGSCYGLQLATVALGGVVRRNPNGREIGVARGVALSDAGRAHPLLAGRPAVFNALCSHLDEVETPPPGATVLASNGVSAVQAMAVRTPGGGTFFGTQYHPELDLPVLAALFRLRPAALIAEGFARSEPELIGMADDWFSLAAAPDRRDLACRYGIGAEILDPNCRTREIGNWLHSVGRLRQARKRRGNIGATLLLSLLSLTTCAPQPLRCAPNLGTPMQVFELFFGRSIAQGGSVTDLAWDAFVDRVIVPNLPDGFTVLDASGAWLSPAGHRTMREPTKLLLVALPDTADAQTRIQRIRSEYQLQFDQQLVGTIVQPGCAAF